MGFRSYDQQKAAFASMNCYKPRNRSRRANMLSEEPKVKIVPVDEFDKHVLSTGNTISPYEKGLYVYKENTMYINQDNIRGPEDLQRTILHEKGHSIYGPNEYKAEAYAVKNLLDGCPHPDQKEHDRLLNAEMRLFHPTICILHDPQTIPGPEKERILRKDAEMILSPAGSLLTEETQIKTPSRMLPDLKHRI
jgi:hypothetical protein